ncbi:MAG: GIY-YIG nuclease family protein [Deltaproteobacteria bacterium]|nr:GIY-YIG nuclease family protein [Deltaproteobacteria bacterium]
MVSHDKDDAKDFWDRAVIFVAKDENLTKAHVRHLEARLIDMAIKAKRSTVDNKTAPNGGTLPEADLADMEEFITQVRLLLATMGIDALDAAGSGPGTGQALPGVKKPEFEELQMAGEGYKATCSVVQGEFVVKEGSRARKMEAASLSPSSKAKRIELLSSGVLQDINEALQFLQDYAFKSASGAAQVICGANVNGRMAWKMGDGATYADWHEASLTVAVPQQAE